MSLRGPQALSPKTQELFCSIQRQFLAIPFHPVSQLTDWFPPKVKPVRSGVYYTEWRGPYGEAQVSGFSEWNGVTWGLSGVSPRAAVGRCPSVHQRRHWRGINQEPR